MKPHAPLVILLAAGGLSAHAASVNLTPVPSAKGSHLALRPSQNIDELWYVTNATSHIAPLDPEESEEIVPSVKIEKDSVGARITENVKETAELYLKTLMTKAKIQIGSGAPDVALDSLNQILNINPQQADAYVLRGVIAAMNKRYGAAIEDYDRAIKFDGDSADAFQSRGIARLRLGQNAEAMEDFDRVLQIDQTFSEAYLKRGFLHAQNSAFEKALADFDRYVSLEPNDPVGHRNRSAALSRLGKSDEATAAFRRAAILEQQAAKKKNAR